MSEFRFGHQVLVWNTPGSDKQRATFLFQKMDGQYSAVWEDSIGERNVGLFHYCKLDLDAEYFVPGDKVEAYSLGHDDWIEAEYCGRDERTKGYVCRTNDGFRCYVKCRYPRPGEPIEDWLKVLPSGYRERALRNMESKAGIPFDKSKLVHSMADALRDGFLWTNSPEGHDFWLQVANYYKESKEIQLPELPDTTIWSAINCKPVENTWDSTKGKWIPNRVEYEGKTYTLDE